MNRMNKKSSACTCEIMHINSDGTYDIKIDKHCPVHGLKESE